MNMYYTPAMTVKEQMLMNSNPSRSDLIIAEALDHLIAKVSKLEHPDNLPEPMKIMGRKCVEPKIIS